MKLKKIASLALAGIMAVSMLAGCKGDESSSSDSNSTTTVTASSSAAFAETLNDGRTAHAKDIAGVTYQASSSLEEALKSIVTDKYGKNSSALETLVGKDKFAVAAWDIADLKELTSDKLSSKVVGGIDAWNNQNVIPTTAGTYKYAHIYAVGGGYTAEEAANSIRVTNTNALEVKEYMPVSDATANPTVRAAYSAEVAAVKMTSNANPDLSVWFVAVVYTQTVTKV